MKMRGIAIAMIVTVLFACSCAFNPQKVELNPEVKVSSEAVGRGKKIALVTVDERASSKIGNRGPIGMGAEITTNQDVAKVVNSKISEAFQQRGFDTKGNSTSDSTELRVEVRNLEYKIIPGIFSGTLKTESALKAVCTTSGKRAYERLYRGGSEERIFAAKFADDNAAHINKALAETIEALLNDDELCRCLAQ
jgi:uncharacterized lipoprotein YajG